MSGVLERRGEDVDLRWWRGWRCLGERERRRRGLGVEDGYGRRGEREGEVDMGRRWRARWLPGEREWWWRGLGVVDGYGWRGERGARRGVWGEGEVDVGRRGEREWWWRGLGGRWGEGEGDMGRQWRSWWRPGERERRERGPWGSWWYLGEWERRGWVVEARWECGRPGRVCRAGGEPERRHLRDRPSSLESGQSRSVGGLWGASRGAAWGGRSPVVLGAPSAIATATAWISINNRFQSLTTTVPLEAQNWWAPLWGTASAAPANNPLDEGTALAYIAGSTAC